MQDNNLLCFTPPPPAAGLHRYLHRGARSGVGRAADADDAGTGVHLEFLVGPDVGGDGDAVYLWGGGVGSGGGQFWGGMVKGRRKEEIVRRRRYLIINAGQ